MATTLRPHDDVELSEGWEWTALAPDAATEPAALARLAPEWQPALVPGTVAAAQRAAGRCLWRDEQVRSSDARDHWYRCSFARPACEPSASVRLRFEGLATLAEVWLNGERVLESSNIFVPHELDVGERLAERNQLHIRFRALDAWLDVRRGRPRWRTRLVDHSQLRWTRTSLLGRMPGWSPAVHAVGPWRPVRLRVARALDVRALELSSRVADAERSTGTVRARIELGAGAARDQRAELVVGDARGALQQTEVEGRRVLEGELAVPNVRLWWPHTHGAQPLYPVQLALHGPDGEVRVDLSRVGFRTLELDRAGRRFALRVNGVPVFCRGACWTTTDIATLTGTPAAYAADLERARAAGMNMLRIAGSLFYESDEFYARCDELGILIWQDFMFANMDYPIDDPAFAASVDAEVEAFLRRTQARPCLALLCGGSEVEQQAAMLGLPRALWSSRLFAEVLPRHVARLRPDVPYVANTPSGGEVPFEVSSGPAHYYGVGAYLRPLEDARRAEVQFASECLAFANLPGETVIAQLLQEGQQPTQHPAWKERVPRDAGASWDFEDVRDHYLRELFRCDPARLRSEDLARYLSCSRVVSGEVMASTLSEWRRARSSCAGALIWFYRDLWPGAGLGLLDADGRPKAAYYYVKRALAKTAVWFSDEGLNGLALHVAHESEAPLAAELQVALHHDAQRALIANVKSALRIAPGEVRELRLQALLPWFADANRAYRFGPSSHDLVVATLVAPDGEVLGDAYHFPLGLPVERAAAIGLRCTAESAGDGWSLQLASERFAHAVEIDVPGFEPADNYLSLPPGGRRRVPLRRTGSTSEPHGRVKALNSHETAQIELARPSQLQQHERARAAVRRGAV